VERRTVNLSDYLLLLYGPTGCYVMPKDILIGHQQEIQADQDQKLEAAKEQRKNRRQQASRFSPPNIGRSNQMSSASLSAHISSMRNCRSRKD
jgi:hypothetical protein